MKVIFSQLTVSQFIVLWLLGWLLWPTSFVLAQASAGRDDRGQITVRQPQPDQLRNLRIDRAYRYDNEPPPPDNSLSRFIDYYLDKVMRLFSGKAYDNFWRYVIPLVVVGLVFYLLKKANYLDGLFPRSSRSDKLDYESSPEDIHAIDYNAAIAQAIDNQQYRVAVRLLYLQTLKRLADSRLIQYQREKTNRQYVYELASSPYQRGFEQLTSQFDYVWYGNTPVDGDRFSRIQTEFRAFQALSAPRPPLIPINRAQTQ